MGMIIVEDLVHSRLTKNKKSPILRKIYPKGKISHSMIIDAGLNALEKLYGGKSNGRSSSRLSPIQSK